MAKTAANHKINRLELLSALREVQPGLSNKEIIEQSSSFIFNDTSIWSYNDQISINHNFATGLKGAVKADKFMKLLEKIPNDELEIKEVKGKLKIQANKLKATIKIDTDVKLMPIKVPKTSSKKWKELPNNFNEGISFCAFSASKNMIRPELTCLWIEEDKITSVDGFRGTVFNLTSDIDQDFLLPAGPAVELAKYNPEKAVVENGWIHFMNDQETTFSIRTYADIEYPETEKYFEGTGAEVELPEGFIDVIQRASTLLSDDFDLDRFVSLIITEDKIVCKGEGNSGWVQEEKEIEYDGENIDVKIHPVMISEVLKYNRNIIIDNGEESGLEKILFKNDKFSHMICLSI